MLHFEDSNHKGCCRLASPFPGMLLFIRTFMNNTFVYVHIYVCIIDVANPKPDLYGIKTWVPDQNNNYRTGTVP